MYGNGDTVISARNLRAFPLTFDFLNLFNNPVRWDAWVAQSVKCLPLAQALIPGSWGGVPCQAPCSVGSLLLPWPATPPACVHSLSL